MCSLQLIDSFQPFMLGIYQYLIQGTTSGINLPVYYESFPADPDHMRSISTAKPVRDMNVKETPCG